MMRDKIQRAFIWTAFIVSVLSFLLVLHSLAHAAHLRPEKNYQAQWCNQCGGVMEYVLPDCARVDCICGEYAIEFDFAPKWAEAVGQSLYYAYVTGKRPAIVLIMEKPTDARYLKRLMPIAEKYNIKVWTMGPGAK